MSVQLVLGKALPLRLSSRGTSGTTRRIIQAFMTRDQQFHRATSSSTLPNTNVKPKFSWNRTAGLVGQQRRWKSFLSIHEPEYLDTTEHQIPKFELVNIQLKGYDFPILEKFQAFVHGTAERIGLDVEDAWGVPAQKIKVTKLKPESTVVETEYHLNIYERTVQISDLPSTMLPVLINIVEAALPTGVSMTVREHTNEDEEVRYIPDTELKDLKEQLASDGTKLKKVKRFKMSSKFRRKSLLPTSLPPPSVPDPESDLS